MAVIPVARAQYSIAWYTIDGGGGSSTNGQYQVSGTIGQPDASDQMQTGGSYSLAGGFWAYRAIQIPGAPFLFIMPSGTGDIVISWNPTDAGWVLQETPTLTPTSWTNSPSGVTNPVIIPVSTPMKFYRLHKP